jgi:hypothetical protein
VSLRLLREERIERLWVEVQASDLVDGPNFIVAPVLPGDDPRADRTDLRVLIETPDGPAWVLVDLLRPVGRGVFKFERNLGEDESAEIRDVLRLIFDL